MGFGAHFQEGISHITDWHAYDHMLYLFALSAGFLLKDWRKIALLATAFTLGHSMTLILSGLDVFRVRPSLIEFLIPITIFITALVSAMAKERTKVGIGYLLATVFGLIHGMGFSSYFRMISSKEDLVVNLLAFNLGVEVGQLFIITAFLLLSWLATSLVKVPLKHWKMTICIIAMFISALLIHQNWLF